MADLQQGVSKGCEAVAADAVVGEIEFIEASEGATTHLPSVSRAESQACGGWREGRGGEAGAAREQLGWREVAWRAAGGGRQAEQARGE